MENEFSLLVDTLPGLVWTARADGHVDYINRQWCEYTGCRADEAYGPGWQAAIHPEDRAALLARWRSILASGQPGEGEARLRRFDGEYRWFLLRARPFTDASGQVVRWCGINTDIEEHRRRDEDRSERWWLSSPARENHFRSILDGLPVLVTLMGPDGELQLANRQVLDYFGGTLEELKGWASASTFHPEDRSNVLDAWRRSVESGEPYEFEGRQRRADGIYRWFHLRGFPLRDTEGHIVLWYFLQTDVDDRKRAEALLAGEKELLEMVAGGRPLPGILEALCRFVESMTSGCYCSVALVDPTGTQLEQGVAPSLPASFITSIIGRPVNVDSGPCAMAAWLNEQVISTDLKSEARWAAYEWCPMALAHGLQACWSTPIISTAGKVLGAFALYFEEPSAPTAAHQGLIDQFTHIASIAVERAQSDAALRRSEARKTAILESALDCIVTIDHEGRITEFNPAAERTFGYRRDEVVGREMADVIVPLSLREQHRRGLARYLATAEARLIGKRVEMTARRADGSEFPVELAITRIPIEGPPSFTGYLRDITERKQAEEELRRSEAFLAQAQKVTHTGSLWWRASSGEIIWSEESYRLLDYPRSVTPSEELILKRCHPEDLALVRETIARSARAGTNMDYKHRLLMPDGSVKHVHVLVQNLQLASGELEFIGAVTDISKQHQTEADLQDALARVKESEAELRTIIEGIPTLAWNTRADGYAEYFSQRWLNYTGLSQDDVQGAGWALPIHPDDRGMVVEQWRKIIASGGPGELEARLRRFDGKYRWFLFRAAPFIDPRGHVAKWYGTNTDIDDLKRSEEEMRKLVSIIENSTDYIGYARSPQDVAYINGAWRRLAGLDAGEDIARYQMTDLLPAEEGRRFREEIMPSLARDGSWEGERALRNVKTNVASPVHQTIFFISEAGTGRRIGMATICRDITERKRAEEELRRSEADLQKAQSELAHITRVTTMGELAASIAHEVNQPIAGVVINGNACLRWLARVNEESDNLTEARETLQRIIRDGNRAGEIIARIRALFKKTESAKEPLDLNETIREVLVLTRSEMDKQRIVLRLELASDLPRVLGDRVQLQQVLLNLILNAIEAMATVEGRPRSLLVRAQTRDEGDVLVTVSDSGIGITSESMAHIFTAFHTTKPSGLGMGLSISRSIVVNHSGRLWATAHEGPGASFHFTLLAVP